jgi:hypothetical protein
LDVGAVSVDEGGRAVGFDIEKDKVGGGVTRIGSVSEDGEKNSKNEKQSGAHDEKLSGTEAKYAGGWGPSDLFL